MNRKFCFLECYFIFQKRCIAADVAKHGGGRDAPDVRAPEAERVTAKANLSEPTNDRVNQNGLQKPPKNNVDSNIVKPPGGAHPSNGLLKMEDCNSSRESITVDVESTQPEDSKQFSSHLGSGDTPIRIATNGDRAPQQMPVIKQEEILVDWSSYHLENMALESWLVAIRKHLLMPLIKHPK